MYILFNFTFKTHQHEIQDSIDLQTIKLCRQIGVYNRCRDFCRFGKCATRNNNEFDIVDVSHKTDMKYASWKSL